MIVCNLTQISLNVIPNRAFVLISQCLSDTPKRPSVTEDKNTSNGNLALHLYKYTVKATVTRAAQHCGRT